MTMTLTHGNASTVMPLFLNDAKSICREETSERKELFEKQAASFDDILFLVSLTLDDMRRMRSEMTPLQYTAMTSPNKRSKSAGLHPAPPGKTDASPLAVAAPRSAASEALVVHDGSSPQHEVAASRSVWFPASPPRGVPSPPRAIQQRIPKPLPQPLANVVQEEAELRQWVTRLEAKLRQPIERHCVDAWMILTGPPRLEFLEYDQREELRQAEEASWHELCAQFRRHVPLTFIIDTWRGPRLSDEEEATRDPIGAEEKRRMRLEGEERAARKELHDWLCDMYGVRLFSTSRVEVSWRCEYEEEEAEARSMLLEKLVRADYRWPLLATLSLHCTKSPTLGWMMSSLKRASSTAPPTGDQWEEL